MILIQVVLCRGNSHPIMTISAILTTSRSTPSWQINAPNHQINANGTTTSKDAHHGLNHYVGTLMAATDQIGEKVAPPHLPLVVP